MSNQLFEKKKYTENDIAIIKEYLKGRGMSEEDVDKLLDEANDIDYIGAGVASVTREKKDKQERWQHISGFHSEDVITRHR